SAGDGCERRCWAPWKDPWVDGAVMSESRLEGEERVERLCGPALGEQHRAVRHVEPGAGSRALWWRHRRARGVVDHRACLVELASHQGRLGKDAVCHRAVAVP